MCIPMGIGIKKAFNGNGGIKLEFGFRFTNTDYLDDVSGSYYDWAANGGNETQIIMSGTNTGHTYSYTGYLKDGQTQSDAPAGAIFNNPDILAEYRIEGLYHTAPTFKRGNNENDDSYMFFTLSAYKKFNNAAKSYRTINMHQKRKIKASF